MIRPTAAQETHGAVTGMPEEVFGKLYPLLTAYLVDGLWDDGKTRETSALSFTVKDGLWQLALNDKALKASVYTSAGSMKDCLKGLEAALRDGVAGWRPWKRGK